MLVLWRRYPPRRGLGCQGGYAGYRLGGTLVWLQTVQTAQSPGDEPSGARPAGVQMGCRRVAALPASGAGSGTGTERLGHGPT